MWKTRWVGYVCLENHLPIQDENSGIKKLIGAKPTDPEAYLLWKKEAKFLSKTAFENALVYLGQPYDEKKLKHLSFSKFTKDYQDFEKKNRT